MHFHQWKRREIVALFGGAAAAWPVAARGQQTALPVIGYLSTLSLEAAVKLGTIANLQQGLANAGYLEGRNIEIEYRWAEGHYDRLPALARDLVTRQVALILASTNNAALAAKQATSTLPIVFANVGGDPVSLGLVASLNRPGGNVTGVSNFSATLQLKRLQLLRDLLPTATAIGVLLNPNNPNAEFVRREMPTAAATLGFRVVIATAGLEAELDAAFATLAEQQVRAVLIGSDAFFAGQSGRLIVLAARYSLPSIYEGREQPAAGGLMSYGANIPGSLLQATGYVARILRGEKPADLPVLQPTKFYLVINVKTAKALGLTV